MSDRIETMRSFFAGRGHEVTPESFAAAHLAREKRQVAAMLREGPLPRSELAILEVRLGDPTAPVEGADVMAVVNAGRWIVSCECGGAEYVDLERPVFMCCACWNAAQGHQWRRIRLPSARRRRAIERVLLVRRDRRTRNWQPGEKVADLERENREHGIGRAA